MKDATPLTLFKQIYFISLFHNYDNLKTGNSKTNVWSNGMKMVIG